MKESFKYKAFISYSHADERWARWLHRGLEAYRIPRHVVRDSGLSSNRLFPIFRDRDELTPSGDLTSTIKTALADSANLIVICSPQAADSRWVNEEINHFKSLGRADRVFCLLLDDAQTSFPPAALVDVDDDGFATAEETEPLAADVRPSADGKRGAKVKLVASLLDIGLEQLRRRDVQRRNRRLLMVASTATAAMIFSLGLAFYAFEQQQRAESEAETSRQVTEFLLSTFKQADPEFYESAEPSASEILLQGALRVRHELEDHPEIRARLMATIGGAYLGISRPREAETLLAEALSTKETYLGRAHPELVTTLQDLAAARSEGDPESARRLNERALRISETNGDAEAIADALIKLSYYVADGEPLLLRSLAVAESKAFESKAHARVLSTLAYHKLSQGDLPAALDYFERAARVLEKNGVVRELVDTLSGLGAVYGYMGNREQAVATLDHVVALAEHAFGENHPWTASRINNLAVQHHLNGDYTEALPLYHRALAIAEERLGPRSGLRRVLMTNLGELERDRGEYQKADRVLRDAALLHEETSGKIPAYLRGQIALLRLEQGRLDEAQRAFELYFAAVEAREKDDPEHAPIVAGYERLLQAIAEP